MSRRRYRSAAPADVNKSIKFRETPAAVEAPFWFTNRSVSVATYDAPVFSARSAASCGPRYACGSVCEHYQVFDTQIDVGVCCRLFSDWKRGRGAG
jgi:hypothetical protein